MKIGVNTYPYLWKCPLPEAFDDIARLGFKEVEILVSPPQMWVSGLDQKEKNKIIESARKNGLRLLALNPPGLDINLASVNPDMRAYTVDQYKKLIELAGEWEIPYIVMPPGKLHTLLPPDFEWIWKRVKPEFETLIEFAQKHNVVLLIENIPSLFLQDSKEVLWALNELKSPHIAAIYDVANGHMVEDPAEGIRRLGNAIKLVHLSDTTRAKWKHDMIGLGEVDFAGVYRALNDIGYDGACLLEIIHHDAVQGIEGSVRALESKGWSIHV